MPVAHQRQSRSRPQDPRIDIGGLSLDDLERAAIDAGERGYRGRQLAGWLYHRGAKSFDMMVDLPSSLRAYLKNHFKFGRPSTVLATRSADGTRKLLVALEDGEKIETVIIPGDHRLTLCLSAQAGCAMGCEFCATARMGLRRNLTAAEIVSQIRLARDHLSAEEEFTNYVFMGMGEPLANYPQLRRALAIMTEPWGFGISPRRVTVSTVGLAPMMKRLLDDVQVNIAVSLHATTDAVRSRLVPINRRYPIQTLVDACRDLPMARRRRITFEYVMLKGVNDSVDDARRIVRLLGRDRTKINLIFFNPFAGARFEPSPRSRVKDFQAVLRNGNLTATIRESRGAEIAAACGQLCTQPARTPENGRRRQDPRRASSLRAAPERDGGAGR